MTPISDNAKGVACSLTASCLFGLMYYYATMLQPLNGLGIFGWRLVTTIPILSLFMVKAGHWPLIAEIARAARRNKAMIPLLILSSLLLSVQFWLFLWAPLNNKALDVSLGYLLMPLVMVLGGRLFFGEHLMPYQKIAVACAAFGVGNQIYHLGGISWPVLVVAVGFPVYFILRRKMKTNHLGGLWYDLLLMLPSALAALYMTDAGPDLLLRHPLLLGLVPLLGVLSGVSISLYFLACRYLSLSLFGLLSYVEPVLLVLVSLLLGERINSQEIFTYTGVCLAVAILALGGLRSLRPSR